MSGTSRAIEDVWAERLRQAEVEGFGPEHDDKHSGGELAKVGALYAIAAHTRAWAFESAFHSLWPDSWSVLWWKPRSQRQNLVRAAALLVAEIERLDRGQLADELSTAIKVGIAAGGLDGVVK